jgi:hypothetical protein
MYAMLSVDLNGYVSDTARRTFNEHLASEKWKKLKLTTVWQARFSEGVTAADAVAITKQDVKSAASKAGVRDYEAVVSVSSAEPALLV